MDIAPLMLFPCWDLFTDAISKANVHSHSRFKKCQTRNMLVTTKGTKSCFQRGTSTDITPLMLFTYWNFFMDPISESNL